MGCRSETAHKLKGLKALVGLCHACASFSHHKQCVTQLVLLSVTVTHKTWFQILKFLLVTLLENSCSILPTILINALYFLEVVELAFNCTFAILWKRKGAPWRKVYKFYPRRWSTRCNNHR